MEANATRTARPAPTPGFTPDHFCTRPAADMIVGDEVLWNGEGAYIVGIKVTSAGYALKIGYSIGGRAVTTQYAKADEAITVMAWA
jgi:hypothetical protein